MNTCIFCGQLSFKSSTSLPGTTIQKKQENRFYKIIDIVFNNIKFNNNSELDITDLSKLASINTFFSKKDIYVWKALLQNLTKNKLLSYSIRKTALDDARKIYQQIHSINMPFNANDNRLVLKSIENNYPELLSILLASGANMEARDSSGKTPLSFACNLGYLSKADPIECVQVLLRAGADVFAVGPATDKIQLLMIAEIKIRDIIDLPIMSDGLSLLLSVVKYTRQDNREDESLNLIRIMIGLSADINAVDPNGRTALSFAAEAGIMSIVKLLLGAGANIDVIDSNGRTALLFAAEQGHAEICWKLLEADADINVFAAQVAAKMSDDAQRGYKKIDYVASICQFIENGADIDVIDSNNRTAPSFSINDGNTSDLNSIKNKRLMIIDELRRCVRAHESRPAQNIP